jgi:hypothetical protein
MQKHPEIYGIFNANSPIFALKVLCMRGMPAGVNQNLFQNPTRGEWRTGHMEDAGIDHDQPLIADDEALCNNAAQ